MAIKNSNGKGTQSMFIFKDYISSSFPLLWVTTHEETRALTVLTTEAQACASPRKVYAWTCTDGVHQYSIKDNSLATSTEITAVDPETQEKVKLIQMDVMFQWADKVMDKDSILVLKDFHHFIKPDTNTLPNASRFIRNMLNKFKSLGKMIVIMSPVTAIPMELDKEVTKVEFKLPNSDELKLVLQAVCTDANNMAYPKDDQAIIDACKGLTASEAENSLALSLTRTKGKFSTDIINEEKAKIVQKGNLLSIVNSTLDLKDIGGLDCVKAWLERKSKNTTPEARARGLQPAKAMLLLGVPGTGKSMTAQAIARILHRPLLKLDVATIFQGVVGGSESNMNNALNTAAACAPCVLFIDELEKAFAGTGAGDFTGDSGTAKRLFGTFLSWMQDRGADVFIVATANSVVNLPPEFLRAGRFDVVFWCDLPTQKEREQIINIHILRTGNDPKNVDLKKAAAACRGFTGAEIQALVQAALESAVADGNRLLTAEDFSNNLGEVTPVIRTKGPEIQRDREEAKKKGYKQASSDTDVEEIVCTVASAGRKMDLSASQN